MKKWGTLNSTERREIHKTLWNHYGSLTQNVPKMQREKIAHLIALIGKREFPDDGNYYEHFNLLTLFDKKQVDDLKI